MAQHRITRQRQLVYSAIKNLHNHPSAEDIFSYVRTRQPHVSRATVYRNLRLLTEDGLVMNVKVPGGSRYDARVTPHAHLVCTRCGLVTDAPVAYNQTVDNDVATTSGYVDVSHAALFFGVCSACQQTDVTYYQHRKTSSQRDVRN